MRMRIAALVAWFVAIVAPTSLGCSNQSSDGERPDASPPSGIGDGGASVRDGQAPYPPDANLPGEGGAEGLVEIEGEVVNCPSVVVLVAPSIVRIGESAYLSAEATPPSKDLKVLWRASEGKIADAAKPMTSYRCTSAGEKIIEVFMWDGPCSDSARTGVTCE